MNQESRIRVRELFADAMELPPHQRASFLQRVCRDQTELAREIEALLQAAEQAGAYLSDPTVSATGEHDSGEMIGRYKLLQRIGEGGFGTVWMAEQKEPVRRRVALKIIKLGMDTKQVIARFEAERQALAMMDHPNIARVLDAGTTSSGSPYFVMELITGVPFLEYCDTARLDTDTRLDLFIRICNAIQHAHQKGIIHRDIKPSNILVTLHDGVPVPKVIDFGIAKATNHELTARTLFTEHRQMIGTPAYMSPEQAEMSGLDIDTRSDIYSLGVLLYELLTGTTPFSADELASKGLPEMLRIIRDAEPPRPSTRASTPGELATRAAHQRRLDVRSLGSALRGDLDWIVMKCLEKDRQRRYDTAGDLAADIRRHMKDEPVVAGPPSRRYRLGKFVRRHRSAVLAGIVLLAVLLLGTAGTTGGLLWALSQKDRAESAEQGMERQLTRATEVKRLVTEMLSNVRPESARGLDTTLLKEILGDAARRLSSGEITDELIAAELHTLIGIVYRDLGLLPQSAHHLDVGLDARTRLLGEEDPATLSSAAAKVQLLASMGRTEEAEQAAIRVLEIRTRVLGREHPDTLTSLETMAMFAGQAGRVAEAETVFEELLETRSRVLGDEHPDTLNSLSYLGVVFAAQRRYDEAEPLLTQVLEARERILGPNSPETLRSIDALAVFYQMLGRYPEAEPLRERSISMAERVLGNEHQHTLSLRARLGALYVMGERFEDARQVHDSLVSDLRRIRGMQDARTWAAMRALATCHERLGRRSDALALYRELLEVLPSEPDQARASPVALSTVAWVLTRDDQAVRDPARALQFASRAVDAAEASGRGPLHQFLDTLALAQHLVGNSAAAAETERRALAVIPLSQAEATRVDYAAALAVYEAAGGAAPDR